MAGQLHSKIAVNVIGVDCAAQPKNVGLALGTWHREEKSILKTERGETWPDIVEIIASWASGPTLLSFDAPLGWPTPLGIALQGHTAGEAIPEKADRLFRRQTDDVVYKVIKQRSLDIGADKIARASWSALRLLGDLREAMNQAISMCWEPTSLVGVQVIEVYPAATLKACGLPNSRYRHSSADARAVRTAIGAGIARDVNLEATALRHGQDSDHILDAIVCVAAGFDFLDGRCRAPSDRSVTERESWIWVRDPDRL